jgi:hypothetical protein
VSCDRFYHLMMKRAIVGLVLAAATASAAGAQSGDTVSSSPNYWRRLSYGVTASILIHELGHISSSMAFGNRPTFGFDRFRPTVYSGINLREHPRKQFWFSASGLLVQSLLDEAILDIPHARGSAFERGLLGGGIGTTVFYLTIGRTGAVSDVDYMARTHVMSKGQITAVFGTVAAMHAWRMARDPAYDHFFARPSAQGLEIGYRFGM